MAQIASGCIEPKPDKPGTTPHPKSAKNFLRDCGRVKMYLLRYGSRVERACHAPTTKPPKSTLTETYQG